VLLEDLMHPPITLENFLALRQKSPKRVCFGSVHNNALKSNTSGQAAGFFNVPFSETISNVFPWKLYPNKNGQYGGYFRTVTDGSEFAEIEAWIRDRTDLVLIRSLFKTAVASCEHYTASNIRSSIGELEHSAKYGGSIAARSQLVGVMKRAFDRIHQVPTLDAVVSVPPSTPGNQSLPNFLASRLAEEVKLPDLTTSLRWNGAKGEIKGLAVDAKWGALEKVGLTIGDEVKGKNLILLDDMYQSGATAHYVASRLRAAGAKDLHLLAVSKGKRDTDNT
jgi:predicted amidophosphoribosyltransferase